MAFGTVLDESGFITSFIYEIMAQLSVEPKKNSTWWIWLVLGIVVIGLIIYFMNGNTEVDENVGVIRNTNENQLENTLWI